MKNLMLFIVCVAGLSGYENHPLHYKNLSVNGSSFKIEFTNGLVFDACKCGCPKDASDSLDTWSINDMIEIVPYVSDAKGQIYMLINLNNNSEVFSWFKSQESSHTELPTLTHIEKNKSVFETSDGYTWYAEDQQIHWSVGDRLFMHCNSALDPNTVLLLNVNQPDQGFILAKPIEEM